MNVLYLLTTPVTNTQTVQTLMGLSCALVTVDILEMEHFAKVKRSCSSAQNYTSQKHTEHLVKVFTSVILLLQSPFAFSNLNANTLEDLFEYTYRHR